MSNDLRVGDNCKLYVNLGSHNQPEWAHFEPLATEWPEMFNTWEGEQPYFDAIESAAKEGGDVTTPVLIFADWLEEAGDMKSEKLRRLADEFDGERLAWRVLHVFGILRPTPRVEITVDTSAMVAGLNRVTELLNRFAETMKAATKNMADGLKIPAELLAAASRHVEPRRRRRRIMRRSTPATSTLAAWPRSSNRLAPRLPMKTASPAHKARKKNRMHSRRKR